MRISLGLAKGKTLQSPDIPGIRLTQEIVRQAIFAILVEKIKKADCLDLYAGSGSIGIEALSLGASWCDFVDINPMATRAITTNLKKCGFELMGRVATQDALKFIGTAEREYDIVFMDPYYDQIAHKHIFKTLPSVLKPDGVVVFLHGKNLNPIDSIQGTDFTILDQRKYGATIATFLKLSQIKPL